MTVAVFDPDARAEFLAAVGYYEECRFGLGRRFRLHVESAVQSIGGDPFPLPRSPPPIQALSSSEIPVFGHLLD